MRRRHQPCPRTETAGSPYQPPMHTEERAHPRGVCQVITANGVLAFDRSMPAEFIRAVFRELGLIPDKTNEEAA